MIDNESKEQKANDINGFDKDLALHCLGLLRSSIWFGFAWFVHGLGSLRSGLGLDFAICAHISLNWSILKRYRRISDC